MLKKKVGAVCGYPMMQLWTQRDTRQNRKDGCRRSRYVTAVGSIYSKMMRCTWMTSGTVTSAWTSGVDGLTKEDLI